ncbi:FAD-dependent oxidoreductase [Acinetobacter qingfengensis]|uniref:Pyridine nucleotide-disulfide oxidoreductase n=1 Tax=Acinetobacter qingfengensis TaxID=1262585 RepID=A0A1E7R3X8_9GAMM|nr:3-phenylpropionate/cinnamic acid dioxygenase ferredoxin--NAD(+) reductase subunit [Acinetobacter qingfengensis]KAA8731493.1 FAD-dependent oxidoreductase [Acinetobacter qingfengensis]OEY93967.1 pyridine nucleotide-disulfide oxidoreductase [Acinetobacter qingfengensis]
MTINTIVIIGAGQAGANAILQLRQHQYQGKIILIGDEKYLPYERPPLSKDVILNPDSTKVEILSEQKLQELKVDVILNHAVQKIHRMEHWVELSGGEKIHYDKLLIATGAAPRRLPILDALAKHVYTLRNLDDAQALISVLQPDQRLILVGGGVIGLELASSARAKQAEVVLLEVGSTLMGRSAPRLLSDFLLTQHRQAGVDIRLDTQITAAKLENDHIILDLNHGEQLQANAVIYGIGVIPNAQLAIDAGLDVDFAIQVNENCQTSDPDIYAAGDVATQLGEDGHYHRVETWENANLQAAIFARHVMNIEHPKASPAWFWTDQLGFNIQFAGDLHVSDWHIRKIKDSKTTLPSFIAYGLKDEIIVAAITVNAAKKMRALKKMISSQTSFASITEIA